MEPNPEQTTIEDYLTGKYTGPNPTETEAESGAVIEKERRGPIRAGSVSHRALIAWADREPRTAYDASMKMTGDYHAIRREATRLLERGFLAKHGTLPNPAPRGRKHVDAYQLTPAGDAELARLGMWV